MVIGHQVADGWKDTAAGVLNENPGVLPEQFGSLPVTTFLSVCGGGEKVVLDLSGLQREAGLEPECRVAGQVRSSAIRYAL